MSAGIVCAFFMHIIILHYTQRRKEGIEIYKDF